VTRPKVKPGPLASGGEYVTSRPPAPIYDAIIIIIIIIIIIVIITIVHNIIDEHNDKRKLN